MPVREPVGETDQYSITEEDHATAASSGSRVDRAKARFSESIAGAGERGRTAYESASRSARDGLHKMEDSFYSRPLAFAGGAFCIGIVLGLAIPTLRRERRALQPYADRMRSAGRDVAERAEERVRDAAAAAEERLMPESESESTPENTSPEQK